MIGSISHGVIFMQFGQVVWKVYLRTYIYTHTHTHMVFGQCSS